MGEYLTVKQVSEKYPAFTIRYLRTLLQNRNENGFSVCVIMPSPKRIVIDEEKFLEWIESKRGGNPNP